MADLDKRQQGEAPTAEGLGADVIVSADALREQRVPPGQVRTPKWPVLDAHGSPDLDADRWTFELSGLVEEPLSLDWAAFRELPRVKVFSDFHCVTTWSRLGNLWEGVSLAEILGRAQPKAEAQHAIVHGADRGWTTNLPFADLQSEDVLLADTHDGAPLALEHGGPVRLVVPRLYAWKSAKWCTGIELVAESRLGFWEQAGYHDRGDPWSEERYRFGVIPEGAADGLPDGAL